VIASPLVATMLESIKVVAAIEVPPRHQPRSAHDDAVRFARSCYDHLAGRAGVAITDALVAMGHIALSDEGGEVTASGARFLSAFGANLSPRTRRIFCQPCLDWTERRYHLKGLVGAAILHRLLELGWFKRVSGSRALRLTSSGRAGLSEIFHIEIDEERVPGGRLHDARPQNLFLKRWSCKVSRYWPSSKTNATSISSSLLPFRDHSAESSYGCLYQTRRVAKSVALIVSTSQAMA